MPFGFLCCGPSTENNVYYSSEDDSSSDESGPGAATAEVVRWAHGAQDRDLFPVEAPSVLPSSIKTAMPKIRKIESSGAASRGIRQPSSSDADGDGWKERPVSTNSSMFSPRPRRKRPSPFVAQPDKIKDTKSHGEAAGDGPRDDEGHGAGNDDNIESKGVEDPFSLNLAFRQTRRLPDVAGEDGVAAAAEVLKIDLTETGIRTLRGLDAFPSVQTLVLDSNGLLSLPMDCPWVPSLETLWLCNNEVENLDGLLCQVNDVFPRLTSLALMGNPIWPATRSRARSPVTARKSHEDWRSSPGLGDGTVATEHGEGVGTVDRGAMHSWGGVEGTINEEGEGDGGERGEGREGDEAAYRLHVVKRLPGLVTLDCVDVTEEERARAKEGDRRDRLMDVSELLLEAEPLTDAEDSLPRDTPPGSAKSVSHGVGSKMLEEERSRRLNLPDRGSLPSTWDKQAVVMDIGSGWARMGLAGEDTPSCVFPSVVGRMNLRAYDQILGQDERVFVGNSAIEEANKRAAERELPTGNGPMPLPIHLKHPMSNGVVTDWDDMEELWRHGIEDRMGLDPTEHPILMADSTATGPGEREKATEVLFETMTTPALHMALQPVLVLYACGPTSGLVVDIGESGTQVAPIFDGFVLETGVRRLNLGGKDITKSLGALVNAKVGLMGGDDFDISNPCDALKLQELKARICYVSENIEKENAKMELRLSKPYMLPDGTRITLGRERYRASEMLFDPAMALREEDSLQSTILDSILACERKTWAILAQTVILTGGTTEMVGLNRRLQKELTKAARASKIRLKFTVMVPEDDHNNTVWVGGSMLASTGALDGLWFTRAEYEEYGSGSIHAKFAA